MKMATTIEQALYPLLVTTFVIGSGVYPHEKSRLYLSALYSLTVWIVYGCLSFYIVIMLEVEAWFLTTSCIVNMQTSIFITIISIIKCLYQDKKLKRFMKRLASVDDTLEELGTPKIYRKLHTWVKRVVIVWIIYSCSANINDMVWWSYTVEDRRTLILPYIINHYRHVNMLVDLSFMIFVWYIGNRFDMLNGHMKCLWVREEHGLRGTWRKAVLTTPQYIIRTDNYKRVLWTAMQLHLELCHIARDLNAIFGTQLTLEMGSYLVFLTGLSYYSYIQMTMQNGYVISMQAWFDVHFWATVYIIRLFSLNYVCERVSTKANEMEKIIHQLTDPLRYANIRDEIYQFVLQVMHRPLKFTGMGFFYFGNSFLRKFFITVTTFVIIMVQMQMSADSDVDGI